MKQNTCTMKNTINQNRMKRDEKGFRNPMMSGKCPGNVGRRLVRFRVVVCALTMLFTLGVGEMWGYSSTWRCVPALSFSSWTEGTDQCKVKIRVKTSGDGDHYWTRDMSIDDEYVYESGGSIYKIYTVSNGSLPNDGAQEVQFERWSGGSWQENSTKYDGWMNCDAWNLRLYRGSWDWPACEYGENYKKWDVESGTTVVWDAGQQSWPTAQLYLYNKSGNEGDDLTKLGSTQQFAKTYTSKWEGYGGLIFRQNSSWTAQSTNIHEDVSSSATNITLFTHCGTYTSSKSDWQMISPAYKATSGVTVYFDNTVTGWSAPYLKDGRQWYNRAEEMSVVPGTNGKLFKYTFPNDMYYGQYMVSEGYGYTNYNPVDDSHCTYYTALQASHLSSATTLIPTANAQKGATTVLSGYTRTVTISDYTGGTVTVTYTDADNEEQEETSVLAAGRRDDAVPVCSDPADRQGRRHPRSEGISRGTRHLH